MDCQMECHGLLKGIILLAIGVQYTKGSKTNQVLANKEVLLSSPIFK